MGDLSEIRYSRASHSNTTLEDYTTYSTFQHIITTLLHGHVRLILTLHFFTTIIIIDISSLTTTCDEHSSSSTDQNIVNTAITELHHKEQIVHVILTNSVETKKIRMRSTGIQTMQNGDFVCELFQTST